MVTRRSCLIVWGMFLGLAGLTILLWNGFHQRAGAAELEQTYVGSEACGVCHEDEYTSFRKYAKKSNSFRSVAVMRKGLTDSELQECFACHTTGYGEHGGFVSEAETPHLKNAGCEVCHGPGSLHVETENSEDIKGGLTAEECETCHNSERVAAFDYKPLVYGGAH